MGFSTSAAMAIIFLGMLVAIGIAFPAMESAYESQSTAMDDRDERALDMRNTAVELDASFDTGDDLQVNVTNEGTTTLSVERTTLLLDGEFTPQSEYETAVDGVGDRALVEPGETLEITLDEADHDEPTRVKVITEYGVSRLVTEVS